MTRRLGSMAMICLAAAGLLGGCQAQPATVAFDPSGRSIPTTPALDEQYASAGVVLPASSRIDAPAAAVPVVTAADVLTWSHRGWSDEQIIDGLDCTGAIFHLSTSDELRLRDAGLSDDVVRAMKASVWK